MAIQECIINIIEEIPENVVFDSHYIINQLIFHYHDEYLTFANNSTLSSHGLIAQEISKLNHLVTQQSIDSFSENIYRKGSSCALWKRVDKEKGFTVNTEKSETLNSGENLWYERINELRIEEDKKQENQRIKDEKKKANRKRLNNIEQKGNIDILENIRQRILEEDYPNENVIRLINFIPDADYAQDIINDNDENLTGYPTVDKIEQLIQYLNDNDREELLDDLKQKNEEYDVENNIGGTGDED